MNMVSYTNHQTVVNAICRPDLNMHIHLRISMMPAPQPWIVQCLALPPIRQDHSKLEVFVNGVWQPLHNALIPFCKMIGMLTIIMAGRGPSCQFSFVTQSTCFWGRTQHPARVILYLVREHFAGVIITGAKQIFLNLSASLRHIPITCS